MTQRNITTMVLLFLFTFGIYPLIWHYKFQSELKEKTGEGFGGGGHILMTLITFGIYQIYWCHAGGKRLAKLGAEDNSVLYLILSLFGLAFVSNILMQSNANQI